MKKLYLFALSAMLTACGYKGGLYLPKEGDSNRFGVIQTGMDLNRPENAKPQMEPQP